MARKDVAANDGENLRFVDRILAICIGFRIAKDLPSETTNREWIAKYLKTTKKIC